MKLQEIVAEPQKSLYYMERFVNNGSISGFTWKNTTSKVTSPLSDNVFFYLYTCTCPIENMQIYGDFPHFFDGDENCILIHPDMASQDALLKYSPIKSKIKAMPTASARTVKLCDYGGYLKLNYWGIIGRIDRKLTKDHILCSLGLNNILTNLLGTDESEFCNLSFLPESSAKSFLSSNLDFGVVYREELPCGKKAKNIKYLIPFFSLFSIDKNSPMDDLLLLQLIYNSSENPQDYVLDKIIFPIIANYFHLVLNVGLQPEWHSQNLLLGLNEHMDIVSFVMRDLESMDIDITMRKELGLSNKLECFPYKHIFNEQYNYQIKHSFMFDFKLGEYLLEPIISVLCMRFEIDKNKIYNSVKKYTAKFVKQLPKAFFPEESWYAIKNEIINSDTIERPYVNMGMPKFR